jgi:hypothetical protein
MIEQLRELGQLQDQRILTDEDFAAQKATDPGDLSDRRHPRALRLGRLKSA